MTKNGLEEGKKYKFESPNGKYHIIKVEEDGTITIVESNDGFEYPNPHVTCIPFIMQKNSYTEIEER